MIRADHLNETYYARRNAPTFHQFKGHYHFIDSLGRQYMIATRNDQVFQNTRVQFKPQQTERKKRNKCVVDSLGHIKLFVRLPNKVTKWFGAREIDGLFNLTPVNTTEDGIVYTMRLKSTDKPDHRSATGAIFVGGLSRTLCEQLLNQ